MATAKDDDLDAALGTEESSLKKAKKAVKKPSKGVTLKGAAAKAKLRANGDRKTKVAGVDEPTDKPTRKLGKGKTKPVKKKVKSKGVRHGQHTAKIEDAMSLIKRLKKGTTFTTRECAERWPDGPRGWAFREAAKRLVDDKIVKLKNADRVNTITRL